MLYHIEHFVWQYLQCQIGLQQYSVDIDAEAHNIVAENYYVASGDAETGVVVGFIQEQVIFCFISNVYFVVIVVANDGWWWSIDCQSNYQWCCFFVACSFAYCQFWGCCSLSHC